jgi:hypothetical protein
MDEPVLSAQEKSYFQAAADGKVEDLRRLLGEGVPVDYPATRCSCLQMIQQISPIWSFWKKFAKWGMKNWSRCGGFKNVGRKRSHAQSSVGLMHGIIHPGSDSFGGIAGEIIREKCLIGCAISRKSLACPEAMD